MKLFDLESPLMQFLNKVADMMWLNILTFICCIPIITVGPALTALHYMALKMARNEECYITKDYFKSFKLNLRQGILIWLIQLVIIALLVGDFLILNYSAISFGQPMKLILLVVSVVVLFTFTFVYPVLAKFDNTVLRTIKNAFFIGILQFPKTILMMILSVVPAVLFVMAPQIIPVVFLLGFSVPAWAGAKLYSKFFQKLEDQMNGAGEADGEQEIEQEDERIFKDELDESLQEEPPRIG
ncbi:MAG: YesL family protein [Lachnospiraceae bacterium]|nr:YesL family protein [Lachnospiraceae bacterium]